MDATFRAVIRLYAHEYSLKEIARRLEISEQKARKILITVGIIETVESKMLASGKSVSEIASILGKTENAVHARIPYSKGQYNAEYPTVNALRIRKCRQNKED